MNTKTKKIWPHAIVFIVLLAVSYFMPGVGAISSEGITTIGVLVGCVYLMISGGFSTGMIGLIAIVSVHIVGLTSTMAETTTLSTFNQQYFILMAIAMGAAVARTTLINRFLMWLLKLFGKSSKKIIMALWVTSIASSAFISNVGTAALIVPFVWKFLDIYEDESRRKQTAKSVLLGLTASVTFGGQITPMGCGINLVVMSVLEKFGIPVSFLKWTLLSLPIAILGCIGMDLVIFTLFPPADMKDNEIENYKHSIAVNEPLELNAKKVIWAYVVMISLLVASSFIPRIDMQVVVCTTAIVMIYPLKVLKWKDVEESGAFSTVLFLCGILMIGTLLSKYGVVDVLMSSTQGLIGKGTSLFAVIAIMGLILMPLSDFLPAATIPTILTVPFVQLAINLGINPILVGMGMSFFCNTSWLLPLDPVSIITYEKGYYSIGDKIKFGIIMDIVFAVAIGALMHLEAGII